MLLKRPILTYLIFAVLTIFFANEYLCAQNTAYFEHITTDDGLSQSDINSIYQDKEGFIWLGTHDGLNKYDGYNFTIYNPDINKPGAISSNLIYDITGDNDGNLWVGTTGRGLNFFNTKTDQFTVYRHNAEDPNSLSSDHITVLLRDSKNRLWIGTNNGINMLDLNEPVDTRKLYRLNGEQEHFIKDRQKINIFSIYEDHKGQILVGSVNGFYKLSKDKEGKSYFRQINKELGLPREGVLSISEDNTNKLLISTRRGFYVYSKNENTQKLNKLYKGECSDILVDNFNQIWVGSNKGLLFFRNENKEDLPILEKGYAYEPRNPNSLSKNIINSLFLDRTGIIWIGTNGGGLNKFDPNRKQFSHVKKTLEEGSLNYDKIRSIYEDSNGVLWVGTEGGGLNMLPKNNNGKYNQFKHFNQARNVFALCEVEENNKKTLFIGAESNPGFLKLDITNPNAISNNLEIDTSITNSVFSIFQDSNKVIWIGTYNGGIHRWKFKPNSFEYEKNVFMYFANDNNSLASNIIRDIKEDTQGNIWIATSEGLNKLSSTERYKKHPNFVSYKNILEDSTSLSHDYVLSLFCSKSGKVWAGTFGGGLNEVIVKKGSNQATFITYNDTNGLPNNVIKGILEDDRENLWLSTNKGLSRFDTKTKIFKNYDADDGLQDNEFQELACLKKKNGEMLFGGINGFNAFYPENITENTVEPETVITNFAIFNKNVNIGEKLNGRILLQEPINQSNNIILKHFENSFSFEFSALHFAAPRKNKFAYKLNGFDKDWIQTNYKKRFATYTNLEPGSYTFYVKASNNDGLWDETPTSIPIHIQPPFWLTPMAYVFYCLFALGLLWLFYKYTFIRTTKKHQLELEHIEKENLEEMQRIKLDFFTNISHEFRTPLTLIKGPLEYLQTNYQNLRGEKLEEQFSLIHKNTNYLFKLVNQLLDFRKINQGKMHLVVRNSNIVTFIKEVAEPFQFLALKKNIIFRIVAQNENLTTWFDHDALEKIINNLVSNAFKFTPTNGDITILISTIDDLSNLNEMSSQLVEIQVQDSGTGIEPSKLKNIFERFYVASDDNKINRDGVGIGLSFTKSLVELHQGSIRVENEPNKGANFIIRLPIDKLSFRNKEGISIKTKEDTDFLVRSSEAESFAIGINDDIIDKELSLRTTHLPTLLVQDDNDDIRTFIKQVLEKDYLVYEAENGIQGIALIESKMPDIIITDVIMPEMDGIEFCKIIKNKKETSHIPVIMLTAKTSEENMLEGIKTGADDYLTKPFNMELLKLKLANIISRREGLRKAFKRNITLTPSEVTVTSLDEEFLTQAVQTVEKHMMNNDFNVEMMVKEMGLSRSNLYLKFKEITGLSSSEFIRNIRLKRAVQLFEKSDYSVKEIMYMTGFNTASYFSKCFKKQFGVIPSEYVKRLKEKKEVSENI